MLNPTTPGLASEFDATEPAVPAKSQVPAKKTSQTPSVSTSISLASTKTAEGVQVKSSSSSLIPKFYSPNPKVEDGPLWDRELLVIKEHFGLGNKELGIDELKPLVASLLGLPIYFTPLLLAKYCGDSKTISQAAFVDIYKNKLGAHLPIVRSFMLLDKRGNGHLESQDFRPLMNSVLEMHAGLQFLAETPDFQEKYDWNDDGIISLRDYRQSKLFSTLQKLESQEDTNKVKDFFIYEHFYVIYCHFYELDDPDHDQYLSKDDFGKYNHHALSSKTIARIWEGAGRKFTSDRPGYMNYNDFCYFLLVEENKTHPRAIEYWFKIIDLDCNGLIGGYEMNYFYQEQKQRQQYLLDQMKVVSFENFVCQMNDAFKKEGKGSYSLEELLAKPDSAKAFFNFLTNYAKLVQFEDKDPFEERDERTRFPDFCDWDRFAAEAYRRMSAEDDQDQGNLGGGNMVDDFPMQDN